ncbi:acyltransferase domain-containing protein [Gemmiger formicilis]|uniref:acyltransferase domain-containing protein n=1 Tax=Gemmiger formicilis TaxID=745368 RepID=UPI001FB03235|nr:acyltransferase domain-containing protein [Gemmiger formicilis]
MQYGAQQAPRWLEQGLPEMVCYDTLRDIAIWCRECVRLTGQAGVIQWEWVLHSLKRRVYRLGRLQYQPRVLKEPVFVGERIYPGGTMILEVHIPADGRLEQMLSPYILAASLLSVAESWNMLEQPMTFLQTDSQLVLSTYFLQQIGADPSITAIQALLSVFPLLLVFAFAVAKLHNPNSIVFRWECCKS